MQYLLQLVTQSPLHFVPHVRLHVAEHVQQSSVPPLLVLQVLSQYPQELSQVDSHVPVQEFSHSTPQVLRQALVHDWQTLVASPPQPPEQVPLQPPEHELPQPPVHDSEQVLVQVSVQLLLHASPQPPLQLPSHVAEQLPTQLPVQSPPQPPIQDVSHPPAQPFLHPPVQPVPQAEDADAAHEEPQEAEQSPKQDPAQVPLHPVGSIRSSLLHASTIGPRPITASDGSTTLDNFWKKSRRERVFLLSGRFFISVYLDEIGERNHLGFAEYAVCAGLGRNVVIVIENLISGYGVRNQAKMAILP